MRCWAVKTDMKHFLQCYVSISNPSCIKTVRIWSSSDINAILQTNIQNHTESESNNEICVTASRPSVFHFVTLQERGIPMLLQHGHSQRQIQLLLALNCSNHKAAQILQPHSLWDALTGRKRTGCRNAVQGMNWSERENGKKEHDNMNAAQEGFHLCTANSLCHFFCFVLAQTHSHLDLYISGPQVTAGGEVVDRSLALSHWHNCANSSTNTINLKWGWCNSKISVVDTHTSEIWHFLLPISNAQQKNNMPLNNKQCKVFLS